MTETLQLGVVDAIDTAFASGAGSVMSGAGTVSDLAVQHWMGPTSPSDDALFVDRCRGATLDVGCGPGRLVAALARRGVPALGIDVSAEAVRQAHSHGATAVRMSVFADVPREGEWEHALLADGNIGIGGDPVRLLRRLRRLVRPGGTALVELSPPGTGLLREMLQLRVGDRVSEPFAWALVGADAITAIAGQAGLELDGVVEANGRHVAMMSRPT